MTHTSSDTRPNSAQMLIGAGTLLVGAVLAWGATSISSEAGYAGVGPNFLPWLVAVVLLVCGAWLIWEASHGGFRQMEPAAGTEHGHWLGFAWLSAGLLSNAALINSLGFILSCALCFVLAVRGLRLSAGQTRRGWRGSVLDAATGLVIAAPVYWMFTQLLAINLPGLTTTGWL